ncbi:GGDEF domain-containing protein [Bosea caraganae]|uniref:diguanylate cyclase n=2 Tax=Bosea caraganae TaxID=2763117 RepID=A0A370L1I0_9HYPH|nr:GGDEF domain-containing protein [Bosea caraganae]RDJ26496.1 GGDEF domain-containing protein [Bosea caraganae]
MLAAPGRLPPSRRTGCPASIHKGQDRRRRLRGGRALSMSEQAQASLQTIELADRVVGAMRQHGSPGYPRAFEVWYAHLSGEMPALSMQMNAIIAASEGKVGLADIDALYDRFIGTERLARQAERTSLQVLGEIDGLMNLVNQALDSSERYHGRLAAMSDEVPPPADRQRLREWVEALVMSTREEVTRKTQLEGQLRDSSNEIRHLREALESTRAEALTDPLTGLANRRHFEEMLQKSIDQTTLRREPFALVMADIDFFKTFNDTHGHLTGDQVLRLVARTMKDKFKDKAIITRFGGEEFAIILPEADIVAGKFGAETVRQALLTRELVKRSTNENLGRITISLGVAVYHRGDTAGSIVDRADQALMQAKRDGRNRTVTEEALESTSRVA